MRILASVVCCSLLAACAAPQPAAPRPEHLFRDHLFLAPSERIGADDVFAVSEAMRRYLRTDIARHLRSGRAEAALVDALYSKGQLKLEYDAAMTRNAAEAFDARAGNCLSLVIMTAAFAKELGLQVRYQSAYLEETWSRSSDLLLRSGHVNVTIGRRLGDARNHPLASPLTIDFLPARELRGLRTREIAEHTVVAMYMNNRAVESLAAGGIDQAYAWAREAIGHDPDFLAAYNTLGVIYLRHDELAAAAQVFRHVLQREPESTQALSNLAAVLGRQGSSEERDVLLRRLAGLEAEPPFHFFHLGMQALDRGDFESAAAHFAREVARADYNAEFHFWLGVARFRLGDIEQARRHLGLAMERSSTRGDRDRYAAKLAWLRSRLQR